MGKSYSDKVRSRNSSGSRSRNAHNKYDESESKSITAPVIFIIIVILLAGAGIFFAAGGKEIIWNDDSGGGINDQNNVNNNENGDASVPSYMKIPLNNVDGGIFTLESYHGRVILLDMFAMWCGPCKDQIDELRSVAEAYSESDVVIISADVDSREQANDIREFKGDHRASWIFTSYSSEFVDEFPATNIPTMYILGRDGSVEDTHVGVTSSSKLISDIGPLI